MSFGAIIDMGQSGQTTSVKVCPPRHYFDQGFCFSIDDTAVKTTPDLYNCPAQAQAQAARSSWPVWTPYAAAAAALVVGVVAGRLMR